MLAPGTATWKEITSTGGPKALVRVNDSFSGTKIEGSSRGVSVHRPEVKGQGSRLPEGRGPTFSNSWLECPEAHRHEPVIFLESVFAPVEVIQGTVSRLKQKWKHHGAACRHCM